jgi:hypothetical protein
MPPKKRASKSGKGKKSKGEGKKKSAAEIAPPSISILVIADALELDWPWKAAADAWMGTNHRQRAEVQLPICVEADVPGYTLDESALCRT